MERQMMDRDPHSLSPDSSRSKQEFYMPLIFYLWTFMVIGSYRATNHHHLHTSAEFLPHRAAIVEQNQAATLSNATRDCS
jgi:uncharacterized membrane protein